MRHQPLVIYRDAKRVIPYRDALIAAGLDPFLMEARGRSNLDRFSGLVLTGGTDVDPARYGQSRGEHTEAPDAERDQIELDLLRQALERDLPVLAICRGLQLMNVFHGGALHQHLEPVERHKRIAGARAEPVHSVAIEPGTLLRDIAQQDVWRVNSRHHQAVASVGAKLRISARDPEDGTIEALERPDKRFVVAVQWHPEDQVFQYPEQLSLFARFGAACLNPAQPSILDAEQK